MILPPALMEQYSSRLGFYSCTVPSFEQLALARFLDEGHFEKHVSRMKRYYRLLRDCFLQQLNGSPKAASISVQGAEAGLHVLLRLKTHLLDEELEQRLTAAGIRAAALSRYEVHPQPSRGELVMFYSELAEADIPRVVAVLEQLTER